MSLPNYLAKIKSSGVYRFVWDKSVVPPQTAETLRLVVGYSEKGPFNTPVYITSVSEFTTIFGNISKRQERKGCFFHRSAIQALASGPILALNLKPFNSESIKYAALDASTATVTPTPKTVKEIYDTNRFWKLDADQLPAKLGGEKFIYITSTDSKETSCSYFMRKWKGASSQYGITLRQWYTNMNVEMPEYLEAIQDNMLSDYFAEIYVFKGQFTNALCEAPDGVLNKYFKQSPGKSKDGVKALDSIELNPDYKDIFEQPADALTALANDPNSNLIGIYRGCLIPYFKDGNGNYAALDLDFNQDYDKHKMLMKLSEAALEQATDGEALNKLLVPADDWAGSKTPIYLEGYTYTTILKTTSGNDLQNKVYGMLTSEQGIRIALTNRVDVEYHYIVDTFASYVNGGTYKAMLASLAKDKDNAFAIINFPSMDELIAHGQVSDLNGKITEKLVKKFALPGESEGASWCAYFTPVMFAEGAVKYIVPSAALVSNNFMNKWGARQPYYIVAGPNYGVLSYTGLIGPDYNYGRADLDVLEPYGVNVSIYVPRRGTYINSNQTAKQLPVSALSKINVRELVIYLQNEIEFMLQGYQWELNTVALRDTIETKADTILENIKDNGGIYAYTAVCDETNNTPEIIDNEMIVLDIEIEPARGAGKMVQTLTIHKTGGITSR